MAATTNLLSWDAFEQLPDDGMHHELIEGKLQILPPPRAGHSVLVSNLCEALFAVEDRARGQFFAGAGFKISDETWIQPDICFVPAELLASTPFDGYLLGAPDLAVEVVSPSETARDLERKIELLLASGAKAVWGIYPETRKVHVHLPDGASFSRGMRDKLSAPEILPDREMPVAALFED